MNTTGIVRRVDDIGRVVIPVKLRRDLDIGYNDGIEIFIDKDSIILRKYGPICIFCGSAKDVARFKGKNICGNCFSGINRAVTTLTEQASGSLCKR